MYFNTKSLAASALVSLLSTQAEAAAIRQVNPADLLKHRTYETRDTSNDIRLMPIRDPGELTGRFVKRAPAGDEAFDPSARAELFWGAYASDHIVTANFTIGADKDQMLLPIENFAQQLKSIKCGPDVKGVTMVFSEKATFAAAQKKWEWVDDKDVNNFILVTEMDQCYKGDDRSPYQVKGMKFDEATLTVNIDGAEVPWEVISTGELKITNEYVDPKTVAQTHPQLIRRDEKSLNLKMDKSFTLFEWKKDSKESAGLGIKANVHVQTGGAILADIGLKWGGWFGAEFQGFTADFKPKDLWGSILLGLELDGKLGKPIDFAAAAVDIPVGGFTIAKVFSVGPMAGVGVHFGSTAIEGTAQVSVGAKATIPNNAIAHFESKDTKKNKVENWKPGFEKLDPRFTAEVKAGLKTWAELSFKLKATALKWGFEAGVAAEIPYFEANAAVKADTKTGVCGGKKAVGVELNCEVGINVDLELDVGKIDGNPVWGQNLFHTKWPLFSTCMGIGKDISTTSLPPVPTGPGKTKSNSDTPASTSAKPTGSASGSAKPTASASGSSKPTSGSAKPSGSDSTAKPTSASGSSKPSGSASASVTSKPSGSASASDKPSASASGSASGSVKPSVSASASGSVKPSASASASESVKPSASASATGSVKPSASASASASGSVKPSASPSASSSVKPSATAPTASSKPTSAAPSGSAKPSSSSVAAPAPTGGASYTTTPSVPKYEGAVSTCKKWYTVKAGENCSASGLATPDLCSLNKGLDANCNNLMSGIAYCVQG
ncbi:hypothetical protein DM02DRAFT_148680 [Periconia macrospinosa]|uniref:Carbohydrate-binding module family 50 protein n=1 Tax=Periconia macrospinosa TaxID=97972 RepID=A0A2V1DBU9_9PLEO|nr:hypothetical protein DM02DRAFT_148680 [Periconia macrospinosa]